MAELSGQGPIVAGGATSVPISTSVSPFAPGQRMRDAVGNEYLWVEFTGTVYSRQPVLITGANTAEAVGTSGRGRVGVACTGATSDQSGWVQIYGRAIMQLGGSGVSPSDDANGPTTLSTSALSRFALPTSLSSPAALLTVSDASTEDGLYMVEGITVASDASVSNSVSATTSATSHTGGEVAVFLNYPHISFSESVS